MPAGPAPPHSYRIVIVDDEPELLGEVAAYFTRRGENVTTAGNYREAVAALTADPTIHALISDVRMPDGSGVDLVRSQLRRTGGKCACFLITGHLDPSETADLEDIRVFHKPFSLAGLYRDVRAELDRRHTL